MFLSFCSEVPQFSPTHTFHNNSFYLLLCWLIPWDQRACQQSIVETELFPFNSRLVHVHEQNVGHFLASWYECECELTIPAQILRQSWLERHFAKKSTFWTKFLIITVIFGSNLNTTAPKNPEQKLERRRSICAGTVCNA